MMLFAVGLLAVATVATLAKAGSSVSRVHLRQQPSGERVFVDEHGRQRIFHGTNVITKGRPWYPSRFGYDAFTSLVKEDFELMASVGINSIRLGVMWPGVEPYKGRYNETYLNVIREIAAEAADYGIYTLADMHQGV